MACSLLAFGILQPFPIQHFASTFLTPKRISIHLVPPSLPSFPPCPPQEQRRSMALKSTCCPEAACNLELSDTTPPTWPWFAVIMIAPCSWMAASTVCYILMIHAFTMNQSAGSCKHLTICSRTRDMRFFLRYLASFIASYSSQLEVCGSASKGSFLRLTQPCTKGSVLLSVPLACVHNLHLRLTTIKLLDGSQQNMGNDPFLPERFPSRESLGFFPRPWVIPY